MNSTDGPIVGINQTAVHIWSPKDAPRPWELDNERGRVLGQRRDTPDNEKWSGRWESNPRGRHFRN
jgi:hypothetical protein